MVPEQQSEFKEFLNVWRPIVLGRVFTHENALHFILEVNDRTGVCRVSRRSQGRTEIVQMALGEVALRIKGEPL